MEAALVYITVSNREEAITIARELVSERLVACANVVERSTGIYWWQGEIEENQESVIIAKTRTDLVERVIERTKKLHSYDCPCIIAVPVMAGNSKYVEWIAQETKE